jgi:hypothetical protein
MSPAESPPTATADRPLADQVRDVLRAAPAPVPFKAVLKQLPKPKKSRTKKGQPPAPATDFEGEVGAALDEAVRAGAAFRYPSGPKGTDRFWARDEKGEVRRIAVAAAGEPRSLGQLRKAVTESAKGTNPAFVETEIRDLVQIGDLFKHPAAGKGGPLYARVPPLPPPPPLERPRFQKKLDALAKSAGNLLAEAGASADDLLAALRRRLASGPPTTPRPAEAKPPIRLDRQPANLRAALREAYDHLCLFDEFRDRLVELPRLFHEAARRYPALGVEAFHRELDALSREWRVELHKINEVHLATEPHLGIRRDDRLYYYVIWK